VERVERARCFVDTHHVLWAAINSARMEPWTRDLIAALNSEILVSAASICEISLKVNYGKLPEAVEFESDLIVNIKNRLGYTLVPPGAGGNDASGALRGGTCRSV
jgi:PIN domain nuclease of toxin-antitoxin system